MGVKKGSRRSRATGCRAFSNLALNIRLRCHLCLLCPHTVSLCNEACAQVGLPEMIRQQHNAVRVEPLRFQRVDTP